VKAVGTLVPYSLLVDRAMVDIKLAGLTSSSRYG